MAKSIQAQTLEELKEHRQEYAIFVQEIRDRLKTLETIHATVNAELPRRVSALEQFRWKLVGGLLAASTAIAWVIERFKP